MPSPPELLTATATPGKDFTTITVTLQEHSQTAAFNAGLTLPTAAQSAASGKSAPYPVIVSLDVNARAGNSAYVDAGYAVLSVPTYAIASDNTAHTGAFFTLYPYNVATDQDAGVLMAWGWGASRAVDALQYLAEHDSSYSNLLDLKKLTVTGFSRWGKSALVAGLLDDRFGVVNPGGSGSGGAAPYRYDSYGNQPARANSLGNVYPWGTTPGAEVMGDHVRHQTHNSNEMIRRFLNPDRMYKTSTHGYGERLPYDHHEIIAAIAPRAVIIDTTNDDYGNNAEGDSIGYEGARPVYKFLGASQNLAFDIYMGGGGHSPKPSHRANLVSFCDMVFYGKPLNEKQKTDLYKNPYLDLGIYDKYYGGLKSMMPWTNKYKNGRR
jgi:endo-1,4-beta-xylanase